MRHFMVSNWTDLSLFDCHDVVCTPIKQKDLDLIGKARWMNIHDYANVPGHQVILGQVNRKDHFFVFLNHWALRFKRVHRL